MSWGFGPHDCQGAPLARLEMELALRSLLRARRTACSRPTRTGSTPTCRRSSRSDTRRDHRVRPL
ncbi:hypothetical protein [Streptomyces sp. NPDC001165]|uniref:hypothetical protein n=1 Tax=Streptomyces sp. NPDC001165 TaxID=3364546 RepID=UPI00367A6E78